MSPEPTMFQRVLLASCLLVGGFASTAASFAVQQETPSHRLLPFPESGTGDLQQQIQLLQQLRAFMNPNTERQQKDESASGSGLRKGSTLPPSLGAEQLQQLQKLMQHFGGQLPAGTSVPGLDQIPREQLDQALADPAVQQLMRNLLEQYARDKVLPPADGSGRSAGIPLPPQSAPQNSSGQPPQKQRGNVSEKSGEGASSPNPNHSGDGQNNDQTIGNGRGKNRPQAGGRSSKNSSIADESNDGDPLNGRQQALRDLQRLWKSLGGDRTSESEQGLQNDNEAPEQSRETPVARGLPGPQIFDSVEQFQEQPLIRNRRSRTQRDRSQGGDAQSGSPEVPENAASLPKKQEPSAIRPNPDRATSEGRTDNPEPAVDVRQELARSGLRGTLQKLVRQAKQENEVARQDAAGSASAVDQSNQGSASLTKKLEDSILRALDNVRQDVTQIAEDRRSAAATKSRQDSTRGADPDTRHPDSSQEPDGSPAGIHPPLSRQSAAESSSESRLPTNGLRKFAAELFSDLATAPQSATAAAADSSSGSDSAVFGPESIIGNWIFAVLLPLIFLVLIATLAVLTIRWRQKKLFSSSMDSAAADLPVRSKNLRTRDDVIRAFHQLVSESAGLTQTWWTHRAAANQLASMSPAMEAPVHALADVYERARYLPPETEFPADQILLAKHALERCESCTA